MRIDLVRGSHPSKRREKGEILRNKSERVTSHFFNDELL